MSDYQLVDSGNGTKIERFGNYILERPCSQAVWNLQKKSHHVDASFSRDDGNQWHKRDIPESWPITINDLTFILRPTDFGHLGIFPEQAPQWEWIVNTISQVQHPVNVLNLFAYSGGSTLAAASAGAHTCHVDASKGMVLWARENAEASNLAEKPVRWIIDDVRKFLEREKRRQKSYHGIILDPPTFGRGSKGEVFKIEDDLLPLLEMCMDLLDPSPLFLLLSCHTPGYTPIALENILSQFLPGPFESGEMVLTGKDTLPIPSGTFVRWRSI